jgi:hypothetical protein
MASLVKINENVTFLRFIGKNIVISVTFSLFVLLLRTQISHKLRV